MRVSVEVTHDGAAEERRASRTKVAMSAAYREGGSRSKVEVVDLSPTGARIESHLTLHSGATIWLKLPGLEPWQARVAWVDRHQAGCEFVQPLHPAVFERVAATWRE